MYAQEWSDKPTETRHIFVLTEEQYQQYVEPRRWHMLYVPILLIVYFLLTTSFIYAGPFPISVPLQVLPPQTLSETVAVAQTGNLTIPATIATGTLTVYNGSILAQQLPAGFIVESTSGVEITLDKAIVIPAGNPPVYGTVVAQAHAIVSGSAGNIGALAINTVYGTSLYLKNVVAFAGGADAYTTPVATQGDKNYAIALARYRLRKQVGMRLTNGHCPETPLWSDTSLTVQWSCAFVVYRVPDGVKVTSARVAGDSVILTVGR